MTTPAGAGPGRPAGEPEWFRRLAGRLGTDAVDAAGPVPERPPRRTAGGSPRRSAVLVLFGPGPDVLLTRRAGGLRAHAGQVAFPGGRIEGTDDGPQAAALREAVEETGLDPRGVRVHATGPELAVTVTDNVVTPVLAWWAIPSPVRAADPVEVERVVRVPVSALTDPANRFTARHPSGFLGPGFAVGDLFVWGFTAGVLSWMFRLAGIEEPWDRERSLPVPGPYLTDRTSAADERSVQGPVQGPVQGRVSC